MDFVEIRKKAKERAAARSRAGGKGRAPGGSETDAHRSRRRRKGRGPTEDPVVTEADVIEGALLAEMQGRRAPDDGFRIATRGPAPEPREGLPARARDRDEGRPESADPVLEPGPPGPMDPLQEFFYDEAESGPPIADLGLYAAPRGGAAAAAEERTEYLTFRLGDEEYGVEIACVREILKAPAITEVPRAPDPILGVILVRGEVIPVHDPRRRLGLPTGAAPKGARVVICDAGGAPAGLLVDAVSQVVRLPASAIESRPQGIGGIDSDTIAGIGREQDRLVILLDPAALFRSPGAAAVAAVPRGSGA